MNLTVIYISGYGRSGSSALSRALLRRPDFLSAGELGRLPEYVREGKFCTCGRKVSLCPVWGRSRSGKLDDAVSAASAAGFNVIIDSSKTAYLDFYRPLLYKLKGYDIVIVHLIRPFRAVRESASNGTNRQLEAGVDRRRFLNHARTFLGFYFAHAAASICSVFIKKSITIYHGDMIRDISHVVDKILFLVNEPGCHVGVLRYSVGSNGMHEIAGNRLLREKTDEPE